MMPGELTQPRMKGVNVCERHGIYLRSLIVAMSILGTEMTYSWF